MNLKKRWKVRIKMLQDIDSDLELHTLLDTYNPEDVYFVLYLRLYTKVFFTEHKRYNPYNLNIEEIDTEINDIMYIIKMFDGFFDTDVLEDVHTAIKFHYTNVYGDGIVVDKVFWLQRIFCMVQFITDNTSFALTEGLQFIDMIIGFDAYKKWNTDKRVMKKAADFFNYLIYNLPKTKIGEFY
jgi:hypothetical protein